MRLKYRLKLYLLLCYCDLDLIDLINSYIPISHNLLAVVMLSALSSTVPSDTQLYSYRYKHINISMSPLHTYSQNKLIFTQLKVINCYHKINVSETCSVWSTATSKWFWTKRPYPLYTLFQNVNIKVNIVRYIRHVFWINNILTNYTVTHKPIYISIMWDKVGHNSCLTSSVTLNCPSRAPFTFLYTNKWMGYNLTSFISGPF